MSRIKLSNNKFLSPGDAILRKDLHKYLGGSGEGGINPSNKSSSIFIFTDPTEGAKHGYNDGWNKGIFEYFGSGLKGDMELKRVNKSLLNHIKDGRRLFLFNGHRGEITYENEFIIDENQAFFWTTSLDDEGKLRDSIVFRLKPKKKYSIKNSVSSKTNIVTKTIAREIPLEKSSGNKSSKGVTYISRGIKDQKEARLVEEYNKYRKGKKLKDLKRHSLQPPLSRKNYFTDGYESESKTLIEAKASNHRNKIRMAIGQLFDYKKLLEEDNVKVNKLAILIPTCPSKDLLELLKDLKIKIIFKEGNKFIKK
tara:strand:+ start:36 stop:965 length:930 start_codon:yes stop_codon:yes gene_type:complete